MYKLLSTGVRPLRPATFRYQSTDFADLVYRAQWLEKLKQSIGAHLHLEFFEFGDDQAKLVDALVSATPSMLFLSHSRGLTEASLVALANSSGLERLDLVGVCANDSRPLLTDAVLAQINNPSLSTVILKGCGQISFDGVDAFLKRHPNLTVLDLQGTSVQNKAQLLQDRPSLHILGALSTV
ncbi:MAG: hypothetical protein AB7F28_05600 [Candidatus Margulisiibacteriota bacterium]